MDGTAVTSGSFLTPRSFADARWQIRAVADFDGDKKPDLLWHNQVTGDLYVWFLDGTATVGASYLTPQAVPDVDWKVVKVADFDGDKKPDLLWNNRATGDLYVWLMDGTVVKGGSYLTPSRQADLSWQVVPR